jgi:hypothetical protein
VLPGSKLSQKSQAETMGREDTLEDNDNVQAEEPEVAESPISDWCCCYRVLSLQDDFANEKPMIQHYIESRGHVCMFLPKFHCELNPIEMLWGFMKYHESFLFVIPRTGYRRISDGKFPTARRVIPECLDMCDTLTIRRFFRKSWRYMDAYRCVSRALFAYQLLILQTLQEGS